MSDVAAVPPVDRKTNYMWALLGDSEAEPDSADAIDAVPDPL